MKHLVLGSRGQVGQYVVREVLTRGDKVIEWDIAISEDHDLRQGSKKLLEVMSECDYVHYLASDVGGSKYLASKQDSFEFIQNNVLMMDNTFSALRLTKKPFYYASSQMSTMQHSTYGRLKAVGEAYTNSLGGRYVWFWNVYGLETDPEKSHVITDFINMAKNDRKILCRTDGSEQRRFMYGKDAAKVLLDVAHGAVRNENPIHVTAYDWISVKRVALLIADQFPGTDVYYTTKRDTVQGGTESFKEAVGIPHELREGIKDLIEEMSK